MSDQEQFLHALSRDPDNRKAFEKRIRELTPMLGIQKAKVQARDEFLPLVAHLIATPKPLPEPKPEKQPRPKRKPDPAQLVPTEKPVNPVADIEFVYENYAKEGAELEAAKLKAPSGGALSMLKHIQEDKDFRKYYFSQMLPKVVLSQSKLDKQTKRGEASKILLDLIDRTLKTARRAAGFDDADDDPSLASPGAQNPGGEPALPQVPD